MVNDSSPITDIAHLIPSDISIKTEFRGGSLSRTFLLSDGRSSFVRKIGLRQGNVHTKLKFQVEWFNKLSSAPFTPTIIGENEGVLSYHYDLRYYYDFQNFFDFIHLHTNEENKQLLRSLLNHLHKHVYIPEAVKDHSPELNQYIDIKLVDKVKDLAEKNREVADLLKFDELIVNDKQYLNFYQILEKIRGDDKILKSISNFGETLIHGDLTVENILCKGKDVIILDPNNENIISNPLVDFGKLFQSLHSGYEFLIDIEKCHIFLNQVVFSHHPSKKYDGAFQALIGELKTYLSDEDITNVYFHEAAHYARLLPYRQRANPKAAPLFYAVLIKLLNEYYESFQELRTTE